MAAELAKALACDLLIATIADRLSGEEMRQLAHTEVSVGDILEALTAQTLAEARARHLGASRIEVRTGWGDVTRSLIDIAAGSSTDMIVVGRRGRGQLTGLLLGSVSQKLVSLAPCAVVVVP
jgi:nucleotide-binding universal stress UspA family protein